jgi:hypothetical protein
MILEALPLGLLLFQIIFRIGIILSVYETKVGCCLSEVSKIVTESKDQTMIIHT